MVPTETANGQPGHGVPSNDQRASPMTPTIGFSAKTASARSASSELG